MTSESGAGQQLAQVYYAPGDIRFESVANASPSDGQVLVDVQACAICGTDFKAWRKGNPRLRPPIVIGHELCGTITMLGPNVHGYSVGQRVTMATTIGCGDCIYCRQKRTNLCRSATAMGFHYPGAMAPRVLIPAPAVRQGHLVSVEDLDAEIAALSEPTSCVINNYAHVPRGQIETVLIVGLGPLGGLHAMVARALGVLCVVGVDPSESRRSKCKDLPFDAVVAPEHVASQVGRWTGGEGFDLVVITAPAAEAQSQSLLFARKGGYVSLFGSLPAGEQMLTIDSRAIHYGELTVFGSSDSTVDHVRRAVEVLREHQDVARRLITHRLPLAKLIDAMRLIETGEAMKIVLAP